MGLGDVIAIWKDYGIFEFYLPFVLMFAIFYGLLSKSKLFGEPNEKRVRNVNIIISVVAALFVMVYPPTGITLTTFFGTFFTQTMVILATMLAFALILYMLLPTGAIEKMFADPSKYAKYLIPIAALIILFVFFAAGGLQIFGIEIGTPGMPGTPTFGISSEDLVLILLVLSFIVVIWFITRDGKTKGKTEQYEWKLVPKK